MSSAFGVFAPASRRPHLSWYGFCDFGLQKALCGSTKAAENGDLLEDIEDLGNLHDSVTEAAGKKLADDLDLGNENGMDPDDIEYHIDLS